MVVLVLREGDLQRGRRRDPRERGAPRLEPGRPAGNEQRVVEHQRVHPQLADRPRHRVAGVPVDDAVTRRARVEGVQLLAQRGAHRARRGVLVEHEQRPRRPAEGQRARAAGAPERRAHGPRYQGRSRSQPRVRTIPSASHGAWRDAIAVGEPGRADHDVAVAVGRRVRRAPGQLAARAAPRPLAGDLLDDRLHVRRERPVGVAAAEDQVLPGALGEGLGLGRVGDPLERLVEVREVLAQRHVVAIGRQDAVVLALDEELRGLRLRGLEQARADGREAVVVPAGRLQRRELLEGRVRVLGAPGGLEAPQVAVGVERAGAALGADHAAPAGQEVEPRVAVLRVGDPRRDVGAQAVRARRRVDDLGDPVLELPVMADVEGQVARAVDDVQRALGVRPRQRRHRAGRAVVDEARVRPLHPRPRARPGIERGPVALVEHREHAVEVQALQPLVQRVGADVLVLRHRQAHGVAVPDPVEARPPALERRVPAHAEHRVVQQHDVERVVAHPARHAVERRSRAGRRVASASGRGSAGAAPSSAASARPRRGDRGSARRAASRRRPSASTARRRARGASCSPSPQPSWRRC